MDSSQRSLCLDQFHAGQAGTGWPARMVLGYWEATSACLIAHSQAMKRSCEASRPNVRAQETNMPTDLHGVASRRARAIRDRTCHKPVTGLELRRNSEGFPAITAPRSPGQSGE